MAVKTCPLLKAPCLEHGCHWYTHLLGTNPQTDKPIDEYGCAIVWLPVLLIENAKEVRQTAAAVESARNQQALDVGRLVQEFSSAARRAQMTLIPDRAIDGTSAHSSLDTPQQRERPTRSQRSRTSKAKRPAILEAS